MTVVLCSVWLIRQSRRIPHHLQVALVGLCVCGVLGILGCLIGGHYEMLPGPVNALMPSRFVGINIFALAPLLLGMTGSCLDRRVFRLALCLHLAYCCASGIVHSIAPAASWPNHHILELLAIAGLILVVRRSGEPEAGTTPKRPLSRAVRAAVGLSAVVLISSAVVEMSRRNRIGKLLSPPDRVTQVASTRSGLLLTSGQLWNVQITTRRPILIDTDSLDYIAYLPQAGPQMNRVLKRVYGIDLLDPPQHIKRLRLGGLPYSCPVELWRSWSLSQWQAIRDEFGVTDVFTLSQFELELPVITADAGFTLYHIPAAQSN